MSEKENAVEKNKKSTGKTNKTSSTEINRNTYENKRNNNNFSKKTTRENQVSKNASTTKKVENKKDNKDLNSRVQKNSNKKSNNIKDAKKFNENKTKKVDNEISKVSKKIVTRENKSSIEEGKELVELNKNKKIKEESIIQKIKNFLAKIAEMQEEAKKEVAEIKENVKIKKEKVELDKNKEENTKIQTNYLLEYYDLPYRYNETVVKILAQTPKKLFVYWDISDVDKTKYIKSFGENFFTDTYPVLLLYNEEKQYIKEIIINDFANSWYIDIDDPKTKYTIQLGRKFKNKPKIVNMAVFEEEKVILQTDYLPIAMSNKIEAPNDHILFENFNSHITFRNVKTNQETTKDIKLFSKKISKAYDTDSFYDIYQELYKDGIEKEVFDLNNPTSGNTSSSFK